MSTPTLLTVKEFAEKHSAFTAPSLRWIIFRSAFEHDKKYSKFRPAIHRIGRKVLLNEKTFFEIVEKDN